MKRVTSRPDNASQLEIGSIAASSMRFCRKESFLRLMRFAIRGSNFDKRFAVRSNSVRLDGNSTKSRSWSWKLVRSRVVVDDESNSIAWSSLSELISGSGSVRFCILVVEVRRWRRSEMGGASVYRLGGSFVVIWYLSSALMALKGICILLEKRHVVY